MKVLHVCNTTFFLNKLLCNKLEQLSCSCQIETAAFDDGGYILSYPFWHLPILRSISPSDAMAIAKCVKLIKNNHYDLVHTHSSKGGCVGRIAAKLCNVPCVHTVHGLPFFDGQNKLSHALYKSLELGASGICNGILTQNNTELALLKGLKVKTPLFYEGNGIDVGKVCLYANTGYKIRHQLNINNDTVLIGCFARIEPVKDIITLIDAFELLTYKKAVLLLVGTSFNTGTSYMQQVHARIKQSNKRIILAGFITAPYCAMDACDIIALVSLKEGMPRVLMEAMALNKPIVATNVTGTNEIVANGINGILCPAKDTFALAFALDRLCQDQPLRIMMGQNGKQTALENFDEQLATNRILDAYNYVLS